MWCLHRATSEEGSASIIIPIFDTEPVVLGRDITLPFVQRILSSLVSRKQFSVSLPVGAVGPHLRHLGTKATLLNGGVVGEAEAVLKDGDVISLVDVAITTLPVYTVGRTEAMAAATPAQPVPPDKQSEVSEIIRKVPLFHQCKDDTEFIQEVVKYLKPRVCLSNTFVVRNGEVGSEMCFISRGELNVVSDDDKVVSTLKDGGFFDEIALMYDTKRTVSIVAHTHCDIFVLTKEDFRKVVGKFPLHSKGIREIARERFKNIVDKDSGSQDNETNIAYVCLSVCVGCTTLFCVIVVVVLFSGG